MHQVHFVEISYLLQQYNITMNLYILYLSIEMVLNKGLVLK